MQCVAMDVITVKLINLLLNLQLFNAFPSSEKIHVVPLKILHSIKITIFCPLCTKICKGLLLQLRVECSTKWI